MWVSWRRQARGAQAQRQGVVQGCAWHRALRLQLALGTWRGDSQGELQREAGVWQAVMFMVVARPRVNPGCNPNPKPHPNPNLCSNHPTKLYLPRAPPPTFLVSPQGRQSCAALAAPPGGAGLPAGGLSASLAGPSWPGVAGAEK